MRFLAAGATLHFRRDGRSGADNNSAERPKPVKLYTLLYWMGEKAENALITMS